MKHLINIKKYSSYFHDGSIHDILFEGNNIILTLCSAELNEEENEDQIPLGRFNCIRGKLHLIDVVSIEIDPSFKSFRILPNTSGEILDLEFHHNLIILNISWWLENRSRQYQKIKIMYTKYFFENIPDLMFYNDQEFDDEGKYIGPL